MVSIFTVLNFTVSISTAVVKKLAIQSNFQLIRVAFAT